MGSNSSKATRKSSSKGIEGFHSHCLGTCSGSQDSDNEEQVVP